MSDCEADCVLLSDMSDEDQMDTRSSCLSDADFFTRLKANMKYLAQALDVHEDVAFICLQHFDWDRDLLLEGFLECRNDVLSHVSINPDSVREPQGLRAAEVPADATCDVCFETMDSSSALCLPCGHAFCKTCWTEHIKNSIKNTGNVVRCMHENCMRQIVVSDIVTLCGEEMANKIENRIAVVSGSTSKEFKRCVNPQCGLLIYVDAIGLCGTATCTCGTRICWKCGELAHAPLDCSFMEKWLGLVESGKKNRWILNHTKTCGKCKARIEKNGGCNHMTCSVCHYEFCWICGREWNSHKGPKYFCKDYQGIDTTGIPENDVRNVRYVHGYLSHSDTAQIEKKKVDELKAYLEMIYKRNPPEKATEKEINQQIQRILSVKQASRSVLMWSYPHAYFLEPESTELKLFEFVQLQCEKAMDRLCYALEVQKIGSPQRIMKLVSILEKETESLLRHVDSYS